MSSFFMWSFFVLRLVHLSILTPCGLVFWYVFSCLPRNKTHIIIIIIYLLLLLNFITDSLLHTCAGKYDSCPNHKHYNKDITLQTTDTVISYRVGPTTRHEHKAAPSSGHILLTNIQCWRRVTLSQWYFETFQVYKQIYIQDCGLLIGSIGYW